MGIDQLATNLVLDMIDIDCIVMCDEQFGGDIKDVYFLYSAVFGQFVKKFTDVGGTGDNFLDHLAKGLKNRVVEDVGEVYIHLFIVDTFRI